MIALYHRALGLAWMLLGLASAALFGSAVGLALLNDLASISQLMGAFGFAGASWVALCRVDGSSIPDRATWAPPVVICTLTAAPDLLAFGSLHPVFGGVLALIIVAWGLAMTAAVPTVLQWR